MDIYESPKSQVNRSCVVRVISRLETNGKYISGLRFNLDSQNCAVETCNVLTVPARRNPLWNKFSHRITSEGRRRTRKLPKPPSPRHSTGGGGPQERNHPWLTACKSLPLLILLWWWRSSFDCLTENKITLAQTRWLFISPSHNDPDIKHLGPLWWLWDLRDWVASISWLCHLCVLPLSTGLEMVCHHNHFSASRKQKEEKRKAWPRRCTHHFCSRPISQHFVIWPYLPVKKVGKGPFLHSHGKCPATDLGFYYYVEENEKWGTINYHCYTCFSLLKIITQSK